jgi:hypothetical protein
VKLVWFKKSFAKVKCFRLLNKTRMNTNTDYTSVIVQSFLGRIELNCCYIPACIAVVFLSQTHQYQRGWLALTILKIKNSLDYFNLELV